MQLHGASSTGLPSALRRFCEHQGQRPAGRRRDPTANARAIFSAPGEPTVQSHAVLIDADETPLH